MKRVGHACACTILGLALALGGGAAGARAPPASLYQRLGGANGTEALVQEFVAALWTDPQVARFFVGVTRSRFTTHLTQQLCVLGGGGCRYEGEDMREVHAGLHISQADFYRVVEILRATMNHRGIAVRERNELLALLAPMKRAVVEGA